MTESRPTCACGCGELIEPGRRFVYTHHLRGRDYSAETRRKLSEAKRGANNPMFGKPAWNAKPQPLPMPCTCGCGRSAAPGRRYISGHNNRGKTGELASSYKGGRHRRVTGYVFILNPGHPYASVPDGYVMEHRLIMEQYLRATDPESPHLEQLGEQLYLRRDVVVHHRNDVKDDNRIENLQPLTNSEHVALHHKQRRS